LDHFRTVYNAALTVKVKSNNTKNIASLSTLNTTVLQMRKKDLYSLKICDQMAECLKDPSTYKIKMDEQKWNEMIDEILYYFNLTRSNSLFFGIVFIIVAIVRYLRIN
jgi:hypothetical protein